MKPILLLIALLAPLPLSAGEEKALLQTPSGDIYGTLLLPETPKPMPVALIIAGSGPTDRDGNQAKMQNNSLKLLAEGLAQKGIASLRFDKRGIGESRGAGGKEADLRFDHFVADVRLWIDFLAQDTRFSSITVVGHSEGALIGLLAAEGHPKVKAYVSLAGPALPADEIIQEQIDASAPMLKSIVQPILKALKAGESVSEVSPLLTALFRPSVQSYLMSWMKYDPQVELKKLNIPILIVQGTRDIQVSVRHADLLAQANPKAKKALIPDMNHILKPCDSDNRMQQLAAYNQPELPLKEGLADTIAQFIKDAERAR